ncbi:MAG: hypothetical protein FJ009_19515 [Chloroflexi bacterium]|nr:hypothetical protein [Chloroflexota bacterium]
MPTALIAWKKRKRWKVLGRHRWVTGATVIELVDQASAVPMRRFVATIRGWRNWRVWQGDPSEQGCAELVRLVKARVTAIRDRIDANDDSVFHEPGAW